MKTPIIAVLLFAATLVWMVLFFFAAALDTRHSHKSCTPAVDAFTHRHPGWTGTLMCLPGSFGRPTVVFPVEKA